MNTRRYWFIPILLLLSLATQAQNLTDPYQILNRAIEAAGGLEKLNAVNSAYSEGTVVIVGTGLEGTFKNWQSYPDKNRNEVDLTVFTSTTGDNGEFAWSVDPNGKLKINKDEAIDQRREIAKRMQLNEYLDPQSEVFDVHFRGTEKAADFNCYKLVITNTINTDSIARFIDVKDFLVRQESNFTPEGNSTNSLSDYRAVDGITVPFYQKSTDIATGMVTEVKIDKYQFNIDMDMGLFEPPAQDVRDFEFTEGSSAENIPFIFHENHIYMKVNMSCTESLWILDTGAGMTVIDSTYAAELGLEFEASMTGQGAGSNVQVYFVTLPEFEVKGIHFSSQKAVSIDLMNIEKKTGLKFQGILGYDFLSRLTARIDYANELISFYDPAEFSYDGPGVLLDAPIKDQTFVVTMKIDGTREGKWSLDTGAGSCNFHYPYAKENGFQKRDGFKAMGTGAGGSFLELVSRFESVELAGFKIDKPIIDVSLEGDKGAFSQGDMMGNLGNSVMRQFVIYLDYKDQKVIVEKGDDFNAEFPRDRSGLQLQEADGKGFEVFHVIEGGPAHKAGFRDGDIVMAINGVNAEFFDGLIGIRKLLQGEVGTEFSLSVMRKGKTENLKLILNDLI